MKAMGSVDQVSTMLTTLAGPTFSYQVIGPVTQNGTRLNATLQMALVGSGTRTLPLSWVWMDNKWKLTNQSVCTVARYAMIPCSV